MRNMTLPEIAAAVGGRLYLNGAELKISGNTDEDLKKEAQGVVIDSRLCGKDGIFVAIKGEKTDGHDYIEKVLDNGALGAICERLPKGYENRKNGAYILVDNVLCALRKLAAYYRKQLTCKIVGIVGSVGKTSTKELVASVLSQDFETLKTEGNFNNEIGVPLTIFKIRAEHTMAVVEMGISGFGEMDRLGEIVNPDIVVMTNIGPCHLENLKDLSGVLRAKSEVLRHIKKDGLLVINSDDPKLLSLKELKENTANNINIIDEVDRCALEHLRIACYESYPVSENKAGKMSLPGNAQNSGIVSEQTSSGTLGKMSVQDNFTVSYKNLELMGVEGSTFDMVINCEDSCADTATTNDKKENEDYKTGINKADICKTGTYRTKVNMQGTHQVMNAMAACIVGLENGMSPEHIVKGIGATVPMKGRCCPIKTDRFLVVDDSYNANPKSMKAGIDLMSESSGRKVLILGDMFELGTDEKELHAEVGEYAAEKNMDLVVCVGALSENMYEGYLRKSGLNSENNVPSADAEKVTAICENVTDRNEVCKNSIFVRYKVRYFKDRAELLENLNTLGLQDGDTILVKASHGMGFAEVVDKLVEMGTKYRFVKGREYMQIDDIMDLLSQTHWACKRSRETVEKAIENSLCFGIIDKNGRQIAFGRTVTDYATMFYVSDVVVDKDMQKHGLGGRFVEFIKSADELKYLWGFLGTTKAKGFYSRFGFEPKDDFFMAMPKTNIKGIFNV